MKGLRALPLLLLLPALGGCLQLQGQYMASEVTDGLYAIERYRARTSELGIDRADPDGAVVRELVYERPWKVRAEVLAPEDHRGQLMIFDGSSYVFWWPRFFFGMRIRGVRVPPRDEVRDAILASSLWTLRHYELDELDEGLVAGRAVRRWSATPMEGSAEGTAQGSAGLRPYTAATDAEYHVPLQVTVPGPPALNRGARPWYELRFESIDFAAAPAPDAFRFQFPPGAIVYEWDLTGPDVTLEEAQARVSFPLLYPQRLPRGHQLQRVVMSRHEDSEMVALLFPQRGRWLSLTEVENLGPILVPELGLTVQIGNGERAREGVMNFAFGFTVLSWAEGNTALTLIGNLPWPELLQVAATIGPLSGTGER